MQNKRRLYLVIGLSYLIVFMIPMILNLITFKNLRESAGKEICRNSEENIEELNQLMDENRAGIGKTIEMILKDENLRELSRKLTVTQKYRMTSQITGIQRFIANINLPVFVDEFWYYMDAPEIIFSSRGVFMNEEKRDQYFWEYNLEKDKELLEEKLNGIENGEYYIFRYDHRRVARKKEQEKLLYIQSIFNNEKKKTGTVIFVINSEKLNKMLESTVDSYNGWGYIENRKGVMIQRAGKTEDIRKISEDICPDHSAVFKTDLDGESVWVIRNRSENTGLTMTAVIPEKNMSVEMREKQKDFQVMLVSVLLLGGMIVAVISFWRSVKWKIILDQHQRIEEELKKQEPVIKGLLVEKLLKSDKRALPMLLKNLEKYKIRIAEGEQFVVVNFEFPEMEDISSLEYLKAKLNERLYKIYKDKCILCSTTLYRTEAILRVEKEAKSICAEWKADFETIIFEMQEEEDIVLRAVVSEICSVNDIHRVYDRIQDMTEIEKEQEWNVLYQEDDENKENFYFYPVTLEERLINAVSTGDDKMMHEQLTQIYSVNILERNLSFSMLHFLINNMLCTVLKIIHGRKESEEPQIVEIYQKIESVNSERNLLERFQMVVNIFKYTCEVMKTMNQDKEDELVTEIREYIKAHYMEQEMSLIKISEDFGYASTYFSKRFKLLFGENFASYLEKIRIQKAEELLTENIPMEKIAEMTGYNSVEVMRNAFRRSKGCTPGEWKKMHMKNQ